MGNFQRAVKALNDVDEAIDHLADNEAYVTALEAAGLLAPDLLCPSGAATGTPSALAKCKASSGLTGSTAKHQKKS